ncbi:Peroxisome assembly protein 12 [Chionoecetes opilio]|uniref:Peroxisome assembly protein 12 n=1 Tax=Chionoecetes opilio TaxID=41210 RepID=A0A8J5CLV2_CHIOP|nr:Peroxisome assembly protein 12 [Chionoecetes opilio]
MHLAKPKWWAGSTQCGWHHSTACNCSGEDVIDLSSRPELYDLLADPYEDHAPISPEAPEYKSVVGELTEHVKQWRARVSLPPSQLTTLANGLWKPHYQPYGPSGVYCSDSDPVFTAQIRCLLLRSGVYCSDPVFTAQIRCLLLRSGVYCSDPVFTAQIRCLLLRSGVYCSDPVFTAQIRCLLPRSGVYCSDPVFTAQIRSDPVFVWTVIGAFAPRSSFAENFYDLKRVELASKKDRKLLTLSQRAYIKSQFALVIFPYIQTHLESAYQELQENEGNGTPTNQYTCCSCNMPLVSPLDSSVLKKPKLRCFFDLINLEYGKSSEGWKAKFKKMFLKSWPTVHLAWEFLTLIFYVRYVIGRSKFHSPLLLMCGIRLATLSKDDYDTIDAREEKLLSFKRVRSVQEFGQWAMECLGSTLMNSLEVGAFFLQFLEWFYTSNTTPRSITSQPIPPAPQNPLSRLAPSLLNLWPESPVTPAPSLLNLWPESPVTPAPSLLNLWPESRHACSLTPQLVARIPCHACSLTPQLVVRIPCHACSLTPQLVARIPCHACSLTPQLVVRKPSSCPF